VEAVVTALGMTTSAVPSGRRERLVRLDSLAGSLLAEGARHSARGQRKSTVPAIGYRSAGGAEQVGAQFVLDFRYQRLREYFRRRGM